MKKIIRYMVEKWLLSRYFYYNAKIEQFEEELKTTNDFGKTNAQLTNAKNCSFIIFSVLSSEFKH